MILNKKMRKQLTWEINKMKFKLLSLTVSHTGLYNLQGLKCSHTNIIQNVMLMLKIFFLLIGKPDRCNSQKSSELLLANSIFQPPPLCLCSIELLK